MTTIDDDTPADDIIAAADACQAAKDFKGARRLLLVLVERFAPPPKETRGEKLTRRVHAYINLCRRELKSHAEIRTLQDAIDVLDRHGLGDGPHACSALGLSMTHLRAQRSMLINGRARERRRAAWRANDDARSGVRKAIGHDMRGVRRPR